MAIPLRKPNEIEKLKIANVAVAKTLNYLKDNVKAGMTLKEVDAMGEKFLRDLGARPSFKGLYGFPNAICTSLNEVIIHGIPSDVVLKEGDILKTNDANETVTFYIEHISPMIFGDKMCTVYFSKKEDNGGITSVALIAELVDSAIEEGLLEVVKGVN